MSGAVRSIPAFCMLQSRICCASLDVYKRQAYDGLNRLEKSTYAEGTEKQDKVFADVYKRQV